MTLAELDVALARPKLADRPKPASSKDKRERGRVARRTRKRRRGVGAALPAPADCGYCGRPKLPDRHVCRVCAERIEVRAAELRERHRTA